MSRDIGKEMEGDREDAKEKDGQDKNGAQRKLKVTNAGPSSGVYSLT